MQYFILPAHLFCFYISHGSVLECMSLGSISIENNVYAVNGVVKWSECSLVAKLWHTYIKDVVNFWTVAYVVSNQQLNCNEHCLVVWKLWSGLSTEILVTQSSFILKTDFLKDSTLASALLSLEHLPSFPFEHNGKVEVFEQ